jgi:hypothetical protein
MPCRFRIEIPGMIATENNLPARLKEALNASAGRMNFASNCVDYTSHDALSYFSQWSFDDKYLEDDVLKTKNVPDS